MEINLNVNERVRVELTLEGIKILSNNNSSYLMDSSFSYNKDTEVLTTELWNIMNIFGPYMYIGSKPLFKNNNIKI